MKKFLKGAIAAALVASAATPALAETTDNTALYSGFIDYIKATFALEGAEYDAFQTLGNPAKQMAALTKAFSAANLAQGKLIELLQNQITTA